MNIVCFGDSNTYGYNPVNGFRYDKNTRWTGVLQNLLGNNFNIIEEGLNGRTTVFRESLFPERCGIDDIIPVLNLHKPVDLLIVMLGSNDTKKEFHATSDDITKGLESLIRKAMSTPYNFRNNKPKILIVSPIPIKPEVIHSLWADEMGKDCSKKSFELGAKYKKLADDLGCYFFDAAPCGEPSDLDCIHLSPKTHNILAHKLCDVILKIYNSSSLE